jgi:hypothetical protein
MRRILTPIAPLAAAALVLAACGDQDTSAPAALEDGSDAIEVGSDTDDADDPDDTDDADDPSDDTSSDDTEVASDDPAGDDASAPSDDDAQGSDGDTPDGADDASSSDVIDPWTQHPVAAEPGRWAVGDSGWVEFELTDDGLRLVEVTEADGWTARVDEDDRDEIEVEFRRGDVDRDFEVELDDGVLEVDTYTDVEPADAGVHELGQAGSFEFRADGGRLELLDVVVADGWELRMDDESSDEIEFTVSSGDERWWVEIELDDGGIELEIDHRVRGRR